ncbi:YjiH family protein [Serpentinicella alkaliphila]|uniref:Nucleoside recognition membrane protein YjiH n=1 Tax=Serpentinicella alkaliphila TaxID=1734049 RepID=A0A4R2TKV5_9FIRM|nr:YjiH family protein [Serpentinicella alkaliphila]TCQ03052.1 nucleoside recognition membrane protein YjiH [Serpentinicella alkaliphila]
MIKQNSKFSTGNLLRFLIPSIIGVILFMTPISYLGEITIPVAIFSKYVQNLLADILPTIITILICSTAIISLITSIFKPSYTLNKSFLKGLFHVTTFWLMMRVFGALFAISTLLEIGPEFIWFEYTGGLLLLDLLPILFAVFLFAGLFLPLLLEFGLLEFFGALLTKIMRPIFTLPGRSSIDCVASWLGDGTIGVILTSKQYEEGYYSEREAAVIGTTFSAVSITFSLVVISQVNLAHLFVPYYLTIIIAGIVAGIIIPRIPPLSKKPNNYYENTSNNINETIPKGFTSFQWGLNQAIEKASEGMSLKQFMKGGMKNVFEMWFGVMPVVMALGTIALIIAEFTPLFTWLGMPFIPILNLLRIPEATEASQTLVVGFADMFLPSVIGARIESELTRFVIATVSVTQLIYMSEVGGLLLGSKIPVSIKDLILIFIQRTLITLPIVALAAHIIF